ncbi:MAG TPA: tyrosinase family protein [Parafilimonas sp.]|nr:tyrosinase family protein [Parafilimonas sp.]
MKKQTNRAESSKKNGKMRMTENSKFEELLNENLRTVSRSPMTFAKMMEMDKSLASMISKWHWFFPPMCHRKDQATLTEIEKQRYICAFNMVNNDGTLGQMVETHNIVFGQHGSTLLLPWHRIFLLLFEEALHNYHPDVCIPYWDWTNPSEQHFPDWLSGILPTVHTPTRTINVIRGLHDDSALSATVSGTASAMSQTTYDTFTTPINGIHGGVHIWVGGTMGTYDSPADPVFWLHHANLDRLWWMWYNSAAGNHQNPAIAGTINPWTYTEPDTRNIITLGYNYV